MKRTQIEPVMNEIIMTYKTGIEGIRKYYESAKRQKIRLADNQDERTIEEIAKEKQREKVNAMKADIVSKVNNIIADYTASENKFFELDGKAITDDIKLLSLPLTVKQVADLQSRYKDNYSMLIAINDYAKNKNYPVYPLQTNERRIETLKFWNEKLIYPRFNDNTDFEPCKYDFLEQATAYKELYISKFE